MHEAILEVAGQTGTELLDVRKLFEEHSEPGIPGAYLLLDHVHPSLVGHELIADSLTDKLVHRGVVKPTADWKEGRNQRFREHLDSLGDLYFAKGQERLESLRCWTQGKAGALPEKEEAAE